MIEPQKLNPKRLAEIEMILGELLSHVAALDQERDEAKTASKVKDETIDRKNNELFAAIARAEAAEARVKVLEEALSFYADPETYFAVGFLCDPPCGEFAEDFSEDHGGEFNRPMPGAKARAILDKEPQSEGKI